MENEIIELKKYLLDILEKKEMSQLEISKKVGIQQATLSRFLNNEEIPNISADFYLKLNKFFNLPAQRHTKIRRAGEYSPTDVVAREGALPNVPVYDLAGAGDFVDFHSMDPIDVLKIPSQYYKNELKAVQVIGDSMEPFIKKGDFVGVVPFDGKLYEGHVYLICRPNWGVSVKRVLQDEDGEIILRSDNPSYKDQKLSFEGYENIIKGKVVWILQSL